MKKTIATSLALTMLLALTACGNTSDTTTDRIEQTPKEISTTDKNDSNKKVIDPFENVSYTIPKSEEWKANVYPKDFEITFDASKSPIGEIATYTFFIESADDEKIVIRSRANIDTEDVQDYLDENNFKIEENEKTFEISVSDLETNLLSVDNIDDAAKQELTADILEFLESEHGTAETDENLKLSFKLEKLYVALPKEIEYDLRTQKETSSIRYYSDDTSFEDKEIIINEATLHIVSSNSYSSSGLGIYSDNNGSYYSVDITSIGFNKSVMKDCCFRLIANNSLSSLQISYELASEKEAYDRYIEWEYSNSDFENEYDIVDITPD